LHFLFAWRYFKAKKSTNAINIIAWVSILAMIIGTAALVLVLSVFNGFEGLVKSLYSSFYPDLKVSPAAGKTMTITQAQLKQLQGLKGIRLYSLVTEEKALLQNGDYQSVVSVKGVDENYRYLSGVEANLYNGSYDLGNADIPKLILGVGVEGALQLRSDRNIYLLNIYFGRKSSSEQLDALQDISNDTVRTSASFRIQQDFDNKYVITNIGFLKRVLRLKENEYSGLEIALTDPARAEDLKQQVKAVFGEKALVQTRYEQNSGLYSVMTMERWAIYAVLCLILVVAAFNMIGALTMLVLEKQKDISVLHALGGGRSFIQRIFLSEGMLLALIGGGIGMLLAWGIALLQLKYHLIALEGGSFLIDYFPVQLKLSDFLLVGATVFFIAFLAAWLPSRKAAKQEFSLRTE
jgi:lipoprotein-releasing system permease protein